MNSNNSMLIARKNDQGTLGFTLLELMVTVSLLAFMGMLAATSFDTGSWLAHHRLKGAARELSVNMQKARMNAIKESRSWDITFNTVGNSYTLRSAGPDNDFSTAADNVTDVTVTLPNIKSGMAFGFGGATKDIDNDALPGSPITFGGNKVEFNSRGLAVAAGTCYLTNDHQDAMAVVVRLTGSNDIRKWNGSKFE